MKEHKQPHFVKRFKFDVEIERREDATRLQNELSRIFNSKLKKLIDEILTEYDAEGFVTRIDSLEIDLGDIPEYFIEKEFVPRFEKRFRKEIQLIMAEAKMKGNLAVESKTEQVRLTYAGIEILAYYFYNGHLPIGAEINTGSVEALFRDLMEEDPIAVAEMLKGISRDSPEVIKRLVNNFSEKTIRKVFEILAPHHAMAVASFETKIVREARKLLTNEPDRKVRRAVRAAILQHLLVERSNVFDTQKFKLSVRNAVVKDLGEEVAEAFKTEIKTDSESVAPSLDEAKQIEHSLDLILRILRSESGSDMETEVAAAWEFLLKRNPQALQKLLAKESAGKQSALRNLVEFVPSAAVYDFIAEFAPSARRSIISTTANIIAAHGALRLGSQQERKLIAEVHLALLQFFLHHPDAQSRPELLALEIKKHLESLQSPPQKFLEQWEEIGLPTSPERAKEIESAQKEEKAVQRAKKKAEAEAKAKERKEKEAERIEAEVLESIKAQKEALEEIERLRAQKQAEGDPEAAESLEKELEEAREALEKAREEKRTELEEAAEKIDFEGEDWDEEEEEDIFEADMVPPPTAALVRPDINSDEGKLDFLIHYFAEGSSPWWYEKGSLNPVITFMRTLIDNKPEELRAAFTNLLKKTPRTKYDAIANRLVSGTNEKLLVDFVQIIAPEIYGFYVTVAYVFRDLYEAKAQTYSIPQIIREKPQFAFHFPTKYLLEYLSSSTNPAQLLKYTLREVAKSIGLSSRAMIKEVEEITDIGIAKGEKRYIPVKRMLPKPFEGLELESPEAHSQEETQITKSAIAAEIAREREILERAIQKVEEEKAERAERESKEQEQIEAAEKSIVSHPSGEKSVTTHLGEEESNEERKRLDENIDAPEIQQILEAERAMEVAEAQLAEAETEEEMLEAAKNVAAAEVEIEKQKKSMEEREKLADELPPEDFVEMVRYYLIHGALSKEATEIFDSQSFKSAIARTFQFKDRAMIRMLMANVTKQEVRLRLVSLGDDVAIAAAGLLNVMIADKMGVFIKELRAIFDLPSAPVPKMLVLEHAIRYAQAHKSASFLPMQYVQDFFSYVSKIRDKKLPDIILWVSKRLESSNTPLKSTMVEMVDAVERLEEVRSRKRKENPEGDKPKPKQKRPLKKLGDEIYVSNAGMPILHPYFPQLFNMAGLLNIDRKSFKDEASATKAIHMIQYLINKEIDPPEEKLVLNKLFVGMILDHPLEPLEEPLSDELIETMEGLMKAVVTRWSVMKNSHPDYIRKTFLERDGRLSKRNDKWVLKVEKKGFDILVNKIPWAINPVRLPWLEENIDVEW